MRYLFTAAAERALTHARGWSNRTGCDDLEPEALLLGLLAEPECRAAAVLAGLAIDAAAVLGRWPGLAENRAAPTLGARQFSREIEVSLQLAADRLAEFPRPLEMATEHILLGLAAADHAVAGWLRQRGLDPAALAAEIHRLYGYGPERVAVAPIPLLKEGDDPSEAASRQDSPPTAVVGELADGLGKVPSQETALLRVLDAAANRGREGLRVIEDYVRFVLDDRHLTGLCKQLRHDLTNALGRVPSQHRLAARETQADVGTGLSTPSERRREDMAGVLAANFARLQESLRSLEEFGKLMGLGDGFKQLRYRTYTLERAIDVTRRSLERLAGARLYLLIDGRQSDEEFQRLAGGLIAAGADLIQLRDKRLDDRTLLDRARLLRAMIRDVGQVANVPFTENAWQVANLPHGRPLLIVNDRPDLAALAGADGVHVGQEEVSVKDARSIVGPDALIGVSTHSIEQARQAVLDGADYIGVGPVFPSETKAFAEYPGVELLRTVAAEIRLPAFAIGGISRENLGEVLAAGSSRIAVSSAVTASADPAAAAQELMQLLQRGR
jgi:thiamine-phosphate pyrophosphorylase